MSERTQIKWILERGFGDLGDQDAVANEIIALFRADRSQKQMTISHYWGLCAQLSLIGVLVIRPTWAEQGLYDTFATSLIVFMVVELLLMWRSR